MIGTAARLDRGLFEDAQARRGLARVDEPGLRPLQGCGHTACVRRDAAHALQEIQGHALAREQDACVAAHDAQQLTGLDRIAVGDASIKARARVEQGEGALEHIEARDHALGLGDELHLGLATLGADGLGRQIASIHVLTQGEADDVVGHQVHGDGIHANLLYKSVDVQLERRKTGE